jgi:low affinity Fe/Cu permease
VKALDAWFSRFAGAAAGAAGTPIAFGVALGTVVAWFAGGFVVGFDSTLYQLLINTGTTIVTFLMVFLIQNTQNREAKATQVKLDELIRATPHARTHLALDHLEDLPDEDLQRERERLERLAKRVTGGRREDG